MNSSQRQVLAISLTSLGLLVAAPARAASLTQVARNTWGASGVPSYVQMYIYVPDKVAAKPPIMVSAHSCGSNAMGQMGNIPGIKAAADKNGFILILPDNPGQNCWDVGAPASLKHDGGGDTQAISQMVKYALTKYSGDATRVYAMGGSSGAMMTQALMAVYPDMFKAGHARAGVPAGCWADKYASSNQWSDTCAGGNVSKTGQQWGDLVRAMYPGYSGHRPRLQIVQGDADGTISFKNSAEGIKEWTNVLGLDATPTSTDMTKTSVATYSRQFWKNTCGFTVLEAWAGKGGGHSMGYEEDAILKFFGLDTAGGPDPEDAACSGGGNGAGGTNGMSGAGGTAPGGGKDGGVDAGMSATGGAMATGGSPGAGGKAATGGSSGTGGSATGGSATGGSATGGSKSTGGAAAQNGNAGTGGAQPPVDGPTSGGCSVAFGGHPGRSASAGVGLLLASLGLMLRRGRRSRR